MMAGRRGPKILVIGAGVAGLSSGVCIQQCCPDAELEVVADVFSPHTTSDGSAGYWEPYIMGDTDEHLALRLSKETYDYLLDLMYSPLAGEIGVHQLSGYTLADEYSEEAPEFKNIVQGYRRLTPEEVSRFRNAKSGFFHTTIQVDVTPYLQWLMKRFKDKGGKVRFGKVRSLSELGGEYDLIVNCCGIGARDLLNDQQMVPVRGQVLRVAAPWLKHFYIFKPVRGPFHSYIFPGKESVVVGGTAQRGDWRTEVDEEDSKKIWNAACEFLPMIQKATPIRAWAGLRPARTTLRLEKEVLNVGNSKLQVIHNYGHGGGGITVHWGCALDVTKMAVETLGRRHVNVDRLLKAQL